jgi:putative intracellular protease/amidase
MNILMILSSCAQIPGAGRKTGTWFEDLAVPYYTFRAAGARLTLASPKGGAAPSSSHIDVLLVICRYSDGNL